MNLPTDAMEQILEALIQGHPEKALAQFKEWTVHNPSAEGLDAFVLELLSLDEAEAYRKDRAALGLYRFARVVEAAYKTSDLDLEWEFTQLQYRLGLRVDSTQTGCRILHSFLKKHPSHLAAHHLYLGTIIEYDFYTDLGYPDRVGEMVAPPAEKARVLLHWADAELASYITLSAPTDEKRRKDYAALVATLVQQAKTLNPELTWNDVEPIYYKQNSFSATPDEELAKVFCGKELKDLREKMFTR